MPTLTIDLDTESENEDWPKATPDGWNGTSFDSSPHARHGIRSREDRERRFRRRFAEEE